MGYTIRFHYTKMHLSSFCVSIDLCEFGHFYHGETNQPPDEQRPIVMNNDLVH
jgi:hypothetical protein